LIFFAILFSIVNLIIITIYSKLVFLNSYLLHLCFLNFYRNFSIMEIMRWVLCCLNILVAWKTYLNTFHFLLFTLVHFFIASAPLYIWAILFYIYIFFFYLNYLFCYIYLINDNFGWIKWLYFVFIKFWIFVVCDLVLTVFHSGDEVSWLFFFSIFLCNLFFAFSAFNLFDLILFNLIWNLILVFDWIN
jgi:hypothetical protein